MKKDLLISIRLGDASMNESAWTELSRLLEDVVFGVSNRCGLNFHRFVSLDYSFIDNDSC